MSSSSIEGMAQLLGGILMGTFALYNISRSGSNDDNTSNTRGHSSNSSSSSSSVVVIDGNGVDGEGGVKRMKSMSYPLENGAVLAKKLESAMENGVESLMAMDNGLKQQQKKVVVENGHNHKQHQVGEEKEDEDRPTWMSKKESSVNYDEVETVHQEWKTKGENGLKQHKNVLENGHDHKQHQHEKEVGEEKDDIEDEDRPSWMSKKESSVNHDEVKIIHQEWKTKEEDKVKEDGHIPPLTLSPVRPSTDHDIETTIDDERPTWMSRFESQTTMDDVADSSFIGTKKFHHHHEHNENMLDFDDLPTTVSAAVEGSNKFVNANNTVSHVAARLSDIVFLYPVTPASFLGEDLAKAKSVSNAYKNHVDIKLMETRPGAGSVVVGSLTAGARVSVLTSSAALKLMTPTLFQISSLRLPVVFHVASGSISGVDLSLGGDHSDVCMVRDTGFAILASSTAQEAHDMALVAHLATQKAKIPFMHFFDAVRTLNVITGVQTVTDEQQVKIVHGEATHTKHKRGICQVAPILEDYFSHFAHSVFQGRHYHLFEYTGPPDAEIVVVCMGAPAAIFETLVSSHLQPKQEHGEIDRKFSKVGIIKVRLLRPWLSDAFLQVLPVSTRRVCVLDLTASHKFTPLFQDVSATLHSSIDRETIPLLVGGRIQPGPTCFSVEMACAVVENMRSDAPQPRFLVGHDQNVSSLRMMSQISFSSLSLSSVGSSRSTPDNHLNQIVSWESVIDSNICKNERAGVVIAKTLHSEGLHVQHYSAVDHFVVAAGESGLRRSELVFGLSPFHSEHESIGVNSADVVICDNLSVLKANDASSNGVDILAPLRDGGSLIVGLSIVLPSEHEKLGHVERAISPALKRRIARKSVKLYFIDLTEAEKLFGKSSMTPAAIHDWVLSLLAIHCASPSAYSDMISKIDERFSPALLERLPTTLLSTIHYPQTWLDNNTAGHEHSHFRGPTSVPTMQSLPTQGRSSTFTPRVQPHKKPEKHQEGDINIAHKYKAAWNLIFRDAFETKTVLRPREHEVFQVRLTARKRLTPGEYDRNIFHLELDASGTNLRYQIGDALGVFGQNDDSEVDAFIAAYGLDPNEFVSRSLDGDSSNREMVSVRNMLIQHLDLFGRPSKKFYVALSEYAKDKSRYDYLWLLHTGTDDAEAFKLGLSETVTFADILMRYPSARPPVQDLVKLIPPIKPRHYSIASSMKLNPRSVHLLVVAVDWQTPTGRSRLGQCTRYLANLLAESETGKEVFLTVDIKPSILRLPPSSKQPIIMAGLGTGMAPFRAFIQERQIQKEMGMDVGPIVLYFGARHRDQEYLYGEELDQYLEQGLVSKLGLAFSRDQKNKVYIQDKIAEDGDLLRQYFNEDNGHFYLCGPTWPVPSVRDAIAQGLNPVSASVGIIDTDSVEKLKEQGRYVLEVY